MPKYKVLLTRMVEEVATLEIEAASLQDARDEAYTRANADWKALNPTPGEHCESAQPYAVFDAALNPVWDWGYDQ